MTPREHVVQIKLMDSLEVKAALQEAREEIERLRAECDEWEERYDELLSKVGGTAP